MTYLQKLIYICCFCIDGRTTRFGKHACWHMDPCDDAGAGILVLTPPLGAFTAILRCLLTSLYVQDLLQKSLERCLIRCIESDLQAILTADPSVRFDA